MRLLWNRNYAARIVFLLFALIPVVIGAQAQAADAQATLRRVPRWDRFETEVTNARPYADPYRDVNLDATFTRPDGSTVKFWGFFDGGGLWRVRFMPDRVGVWRYEATFSDGASGASGAFECVASDLPGMISVYEPNPIWFGFADGDPILLRSLHVGDRFFARNWDDPANPADGEKRKAFLDWAQAQGYNMLSIASHFLNRNAKGRGAGWETPKLWPLDASEYRRMETILDDLARRRILIFPFAGFFGKDSGFPRDPVDQELYTRYTLARLGPYWNLLFNVAGPEPNLKSRSYLSFEEVTRLGRLIRRLDVFGHPLTVHNPSGPDPYRDSDWSAFGTLQGPKTLDRATLGRVMIENHHAAKPLYAQETLWPGNKLHPPYTDEDVRKHAWVLLCSGATINFGDMAGDSSSGFSGTLDLADKVQSRHDAIKRVWDGFATLPFARMKPRPELANAGWCLAELGREYLVYLERPAVVDVKIDGGPFRVEWINPRDTASRRDGGVSADGRNLTPPAAGADWLLRLTRADAAEMGP